MYSIKKQIGSIIKALGIVAVIAALATIALPSNTYAASATGAVSAPAYGKLFVKVTSQDSAQPISNATVLVRNQVGEVVQKSAVDENGIASFALSEGNYKIVVSADKYSQVIQAVKVFNGKVTRVAVTLVTTGITPSGR